MDDIHVSRGVPCREWIEQPMAESSTVVTTPPCTVPSRAGYTHAGVGVPTIANTAAWSTMRTTNPIAQTPTARQVLV